MLRLQIPDQELWDPRIERFVIRKGGEVELEHSLASISKWESKWHIPFHDDRKEKTYEQNLDYIKCMMIDENQDPACLDGLTEENIKSIIDYINDSATATWFNEGKTTKTTKREIITAEIIYYWMTAYNIPMEYQFWHLNKLITLIRVASEKNNTDKSNKRNRADLAAQRRALNAARKKKYKTRG